MADMSISGVVSGMDWESMIDKIIEKAQQPAMVQVNKRTNLTNKKSLFEEMKVMFQSIQSSMTPLKLSSTYKAKEIEIERIDTNGSYKGVLSATVNADAEVNVYDLEVQQIARAQTNRSNRITASNLSSALGDLTSSTLYITAAGQKIGVQVNSTDSLESLRSKINTTLKTLDTPLAVTASVVDNMLILKSDNTGLGKETTEETIRYGLNSYSTLSNISVDEGGKLTISNGSKKYTEGTDYVVVNGNEIRWKQYEDTGNIKLGENINAKYIMGTGDVFSKTVKRGSNDTDKDVLNFGFIDNGTLANRITLTSTTTTINDDGEEITTTTSYKYGKDFTINEDGSVEWLKSSKSTTREPESYTVSYTKTDALSYTITREIAGDDDFDITELEEAYGSEIPTLTLKDSDGNLRTYLNPSDTSKFELTDAAGNVYKYGRDYVIRVNDDGDGYVISWSKEEASSSISDITATYMEHKNISIANIQTAPTSGSDYAFTYNNSKTYKSDGNDSTSVSRLLDYDISSDEYKNVVITDGDGNTYKYGRDYTINSKGMIEWTDQTPTQPDNNFNASYIFSDINSFTHSGTRSDDTSIINTSLSPENLGLDTFTISGFDGYEFITEEYGASAFTLTDDNNEEYTYGIDYIVGTNDNGELAIYWSDSEEGLAAGLWGNHVPSGEYSITYNPEITSGLSVSVDETYFNIEDILGFTPLNYDNLVLTDEDENNYYYGKDFTINDEGFIEWLDESSLTDDISHPAEGEEYTITYESFNGIYATGTYEGDSVAVNLPASSNSYLSYERVLRDLGLSTSSDESDIDEAFAQAFRLTDGTNEYVYGTDFYITASEDEDDTSDKHGLVISWYSDGSTPENGAALTINYNGRGDSGGEVFEIEKAITRSNIDTVLAGTGGTPEYSYFEGGNATITQGSKTFYQGIDFDVAEDEDTGLALIEWKTGTNYEWYFPASGSGSRYNINLTTSDGVSKTFTAIRSYNDTLDMSEWGLTNYTGELSSIKYGDKEYDLSKSEDLETLQNTLGVVVNTSSKFTENGNMTVFDFNWLTPTQNTKEDLPSYGDELSVEYEYSSNVFTLSDDSDGALLSALGFDNDDEDHYTAAQDAILILDGDSYTRSSNYIGEAYDNELIKGVTMTLKGAGQVSMEIAHDAEKAVESIQNFVDGYNDLINWINTRITEKQLDKTASATVDNDDFRMRWGLLHGNSLLRQSKTQMRNIATQNFTFSFSTRQSSEEIYGTMLNNGLRSTSTLRLRTGTRYVDVSIDPTDTLQDIVNKINDDSKGGPMNDIYYDSDGNKLEQALLTVKVENDKLVISSTSNDEITISGSAAMNALKMNYTYKGLYQIGIATTSEDYGKSGELEFNTDDFMTALEDNPDEVQAMMLKFAGEMDSWVKSMIMSSASGNTSGTLTRQIEDIDTQIASIDEYLEKYQDRLDRQEETLRTKYAAAEQTLAKLTQQANSIAAILNQLNGYANNNSNS